MKKIAFFTLVCLTALILTNSSYADKTVRYRNAKSLGVGDTRVASGFDYNGFVDNPALLSRVSYFRLSIINLPLSINKNFYSIGKFINDNREKFQTYDDLSIADKRDFINDIQEHDSKWGRVTIAPMVDLSTNFLGYGVGLAVFNTSDVGVKIDRGIYEPRVWGEGYSNTTAVLGISKQLFMLYPGLNVGVNFKFMNRRKTDLFQIPASDLGNFAETIEPIIDEISEKKRNKFAMDVGALLDLPVIDAEVGAAIISLGDGRGASVDFGIAKRMLSDRLTLLADYIDFLDSNKENVFRKLHMGAQYKYEFLALRLGLNSGYPTLGFGLNSRIIDIDFAYFTEELSKGPGGFDDPRYVLQTKFGW